MFCFFKISSQNQRFLNDCINSKQTKKPKTREVFSVDPACGVLALSGRPAGAGAVDGAAVRSCPRAPAGEQAGISDFPKRKKTPHPGDDTPTAPPVALRAEGGCCWPSGRHRAGPLKARAQAWPLCWVLQPLGPLSLLSLPSLELRGRGCPVCEKPCRTIVELSKSSLSLVSFLQRNVQLCIVSHNLLC